MCVERVVVDDARFWSQDGAEVDDMIERLLEGRHVRPGKPVQLTEPEIRQLCIRARDIFLEQPNLLELDAPIKICGAASMAQLSLFLRLGPWTHVLGGSGGAAEAFVP